MSETLRNIIIWLKKPRSGWVIRDIPKVIAETVLLHTKKVVKVAKIFGKNIPWLDYEKFVKMALYHDLAEYIEKDYLPWEISSEEKHKRERVVIEHLRDKLGRWQEVYDIWMEFEQQKTVEAILLRQLDKLDAAVQALDYEKAGYGKVVDFYPDTEKKLTDPTLKKIFAILLKKQYQHISYFEQYLLLLELIGDEETFHEHMRQ